MSLKPATIARADYPLVKKPQLGGEIRVFTTTEPAGLIKKLQNVGGGLYEPTLLADEGTYGGVTVCAVGPNGLTGEISGLITVPDWCINKSTNFPCGKAAEGQVPANGWGARGEILHQLEIPDYVAGASPALWYEIGAVTESRGQLPMRGNKSIPAGMEEAAYTVPGVTKAGSLTVTALDYGHEEGLRKIGGRSATLMLRCYRAGGMIETGRIFILDWVPSPEMNFPTGESEATNSATGTFTLFAAISADGTP